MDEGLASVSAFPEERLNLQTLLLVVIAQLFVPIEQSITWRREEKKLKDSTKSFLMSTSWHSQEKKKSLMCFLSKSLLAHHFYPHHPKWKSSRKDETLQSVPCSLYSQLFS